VFQIVFIQFFIVIQKVKNAHLLQIGRRFLINTIQHILHEYVDNISYTHTYQNCGTVVFKIILAKACFVQNIQFWLDQWPQMIIRRTFC